jgi:hypothetical protein
MLIFLDADTDFSQRPKSIKEENVQKIIIDSQWISIKRKLGQYYQCVAVGFIVNYWD